MKNNTFSDTIIPFVSKTALALASGLFLVSCGIQSGYTETDGIYYDPATDKIERKLAWQEPDYYDMDERTGFEDDNNQTGIIGQAQKNQQLQNQKYSNKNWGGDSQRISSSSDWGTYTGTQNNFYYDNYSSWGYPYYGSFYSPYYFGYYNSYFGYPRSSGWGLGFSWGMSPWSYNYNYYYNPYWNYNYWGYSPYYYNNYYYNPYYYNPYYRGYYDGYYYDNYYSPRYYRTPARTYKRSSDPDEIYRGNDNNSYRSRTYTPNNGGFNRSNNQMNRPNNGFDSPSDWGNHNSDIERYQQQNNTWRDNSSSNNGGNSGSSTSGNGGFGRRSNW